MKSYGSRPLMDFCTAIHTYVHAPGKYACTTCSNDMVYVSEGSNHRVSVFTSEGVFVSSFGSRGEGPGQFRFPRGVAVDYSGVVYVCDRDNNRVQIF